MRNVSHMESFLNTEDIKHIYVPTILAITALYVPIFLLSIFNHSILRISKWILTIPIVVYLLVIPTYPSIRNIPIFNTLIAGLAIYYAQKVCEWLVIRRNEFYQWSFFDIHHELYFYRVYIQSLDLKKLNQTRKQIFFTGPIQYNKHFKSLIYLSWSIIKNYLLFDLVLYLISQILKTDLYEKCFFVRILINLSSGYIVYLLLTINYEIVQYILCLIFNRPLELIPDLFREPYRAISPSDFWSRWHQIFKNTWIELIFKPTSIFLRHYLPKSVSYSISSMCVFLFSGIVHEYMDYITFNKISGNPMKFFFLQGFAVLIEHIFKQIFPRLYIPKFIGFIFTFLFNGITVGYFLKPWIVYLKKNPTLKLKYSLVKILLIHLHIKM